jgi:hypothetical protein
MADMDKDREYEFLAQLEQQTTQTRHATFTAILGVSFLLPGFAVQAGKLTAVEFMGFQTNLSHLVFFLGFVFYLFAIFHYHWYHRHSHFYRKRLKEIEKELGISVYSLRVRPQYGRFKMHFEWALHIIGIVYGIMTLEFVGWRLFLFGMAVLVIPYLLMMIASCFSEVEPMEKK